MYPKQITRSSKITYIEREEFDDSNNPITIGENLFYFKEINEFRKYINELLGSALAKKFSLKTVDYKLACIETEDDTIYGLISRNFFKKNKKYVQAPTITKQTKIPTGIENLNTIRSFFRNNQDFEIFVLELLKMSVLDFYMNQVDRVKENFYIIESKTKLSLAPLYDYSESFNVNDDNFLYDYTFNYPINRNSSSYIYGNAIMKLQFPSEELDELFKKYPLFLEYFKTILNIDMNALLSEISKKHDIIIPKSTKDEYTQFDKEKKEFVRNLI